jgi:hypothetical protein
MKICLSLLTFAALTAGIALPLRAGDTLSLHKVTFAATATQPSGTQAGKTVTVPITAKNLLAVFGVSGVAAKDTVFAFDSTTGSYVLASKDRQTIYGTVLTFDPADFVAFNISGPQYNPNFGSYRGGGAITMLNGVLKGTCHYAVFSKAKKVSEPASFLAYGTLDSTVTLIKGTVLESGANPP